MDKFEGEERVLRRRARDTKDWKIRRRGADLERLCGVMEAFMGGLGKVREAKDDLIRGMDIWVSIELRRRRDERDREGDSEKLLCINFLHQWEML